MNDRQRRIARARLLRREGKTYDEIRGVIGPVDDKTLQAWCKGIPRPAATFRSHPKDEVRRECRRLRAEGWSINEIAQKTGASKGSVSPWVADVKCPPIALSRRIVISEQARRRAGESHRRRARDRQQSVRQDARAAFGEPSQRDLFIAGVALYWAEGAKDKPWRRNGRVVLINSDADVLKLFLRWLDLVGVAEEDRTYRLNIHESADVPAHERWWADGLQVPLASFGRATLKRHKPTTVRLNTAEHYHGCLVISVRRSSRLYDCIEGWWSALIRGAAL
ncbi:MAG TPA: hypothetical protein VFJ17_11320 [Mycobacteriales bacterium]|jgi:hypothetical protein|nr:hypothetical protein [Mycobacteriales bacterium]